MQKEYGEDIFGNDIFIDHLHFNQKGNRIVAKIISNELAKSLDLIRKKKKRQMHFSIMMKILIKAYTTTCCFTREIACQTIKGLVNKPPFSEMLIKYSMDESDFPVPADDTDRYLLDLIEKNIGKVGRSGIYLIDYYAKNNRTDVASGYARAEIFLYPGSVMPYYYAARFYSMYGNDPEKAAELYKMAYKLSEKNKDILY